MSRSVRGCIPDVVCTNRFGQYLPDHAFSISLGYGCTCRVRRLLPAASCHGAPFWYIEPFPGAQFLPAEFPAGHRPFIIDGAAPDCPSVPIGLILPEVTAGDIGKKVAAILPQAPFAKVVQLVRFALLYKDKREPSAALPASATDTRAGNRVRRFHILTLDVQREKNRVRAGLPPIHPTCDSQRRDRFIIYQGVIPFSR